jgi:hypothetical protein
MVDGKDMKIKQSKKDELGYLEEVKQGNLARMVNISERLPNFDTNFV